MRALIIDNGDYTYLAERLAQEIDVSYYSPWTNSVPMSRLVYAGMGLDGVARVNDPIRELNENPPDIVVVPDLYQDDLAGLARTMGIPCFGSGPGARLETDRLFLKEFLLDRGLPVGFYEEVDGIDALEKYLRNPNNEDKWIKVSVFRGDMNTRHHETWKKSAVWFADLARRLGPIGRKIKFIIDDPIPDALEVSIEGIYIDGQLLEPFMVGMEIKDSGEFGFYCDSQENLPQGICETLVAVSEYFDETKYRGFFAIEMRILEDGETFLTDVACRIPTPPGGALTSSMLNLVEVMTNGAEGEVTPIDVGAAKFLTEIELKSSWVVKDFLPVWFPEDVADRIVLLSACKINGDYWIIPHTPEDEEMEAFGSAFSYGATPEECEKGCKEAAEAVETERLVYKSDVLAEAQKQMAEAAKLGIKP